MLISMFNRWRFWVFFPPPYAAARIWTDVSGVALRSGPFERRSTNWSTTPRIFLSLIWQVLGFIILFKEWPELLKRPSLFKAIGWRLYYLQFPGNYFQCKTKRDIRFGSKYKPRFFIKETAFAVFGAEITAPFIFLLLLLFVLFIFFLSLSFFFLQQKKSGIGFEPILNRF